MKRHRWHKAGNHSLCKPGCGGNQPIPVPSRDFGEDSGDLDPAAELRALAVQLRAASAANPSDSILAREYRLTLQALPAPRDSGVDELLREIAGYSRPVPPTQTVNWLDDDG